MKEGPKTVQEAENLDKYKDTQDGFLLETIKFNDIKQLKSQLPSKKIYAGNNKINELKRQLNEEKNKNQKLMEENNNLKKKIEKYEITIKSLKDEINKKNIEIEQYKLDKQSDDYITSIKPGEKIMSINFVSMGRQDIINYSLVCKNTDLFVRLEERLYNDFPQFKNYETYFEVNTKRIKRFKTLEENNIKNKNIINMFIIDN